MGISQVFVRGTISSAEFTSGDRFVIGSWPTSPIGPFADVMWNSHGRRILLAPSDDAAAFITSIYTFDDVRVGLLQIESDGRQTSAVGHGVEIHLRGGARRPIPFRRPLAITRFVEAPIARFLMGVNTYGVSPTGAREWYQSNGWRWVEQGHASLNGVDLGPLRPFSGPVGVGFSEPPRRPSIVQVRVTINPPSVTP